MNRSSLSAACVALALVAGGMAGAGPVRAQTSVSVGVVNDFAGWNPYADSTAQMYMIWCQTYGCLGGFNTKTGEYEGMLAESWSVDKADPRVWTFNLRKGLKRHKDGKELTAEDVVHSLYRAKNDPRAAQTNNVRPIVKAEAVDAHTVRFTTKEPTAPLLAYIFDRLIVTGKDLFDKHGSDADRKAPLGWGPYMVEDIAIGQRMVLRKNDGAPGVKKENPDRLIFRRIKEDEARITALLNGELQIAQFIPPHMVSRVEARKGVRVVGVPPAQIMFLAMNPKFKPWDNRKLRQAVSYAVDRELIVKTLFQGRASVLHGPVGPGQYAYSPDVTPKYNFDPKKAKALVKEAGFPDGVDVDFYATGDRYINDRQVGTAIAQMLTAVGIRTRLHTPEWSIHWPAVRKGKVPFYYQGRSSVIDPSAAVHQYFHSGVTPRIGYRNEKVDALLVAESKEFDPAKRKKLLLEAFNAIQEDAPALFLWRVDMVYGISEKIGFEPRSDERVFGVDIAVK
jgi:peptide/nickel transport system substrate-binding protein